MFNRHKHIWKIVAINHYEQEEYDDLTFSWLTVPYTRILKICTIGERHFDTRSIHGTWTFEELTK